MLVEGRLGRYENLVDRFEDMPPRVPSPETELAWAAGFWDGEGHSAKYKAFSMQLSATTPTDIWRFYKAVGLRGKLTIRETIERRKARGDKINSCYLWTAVCVGAREVMVLLWPYLGDVKRYQMFNASLKKGRPTIYKKRPKLYNPKKWQQISVPGCSSPLASDWGALGPSIPPSRRVPLGGRHAPNL